MNRDKLKAELMRDEGRLLRVYRDTKNLLTVGIGHLVIPEDDLHDGDVITPERCDELFYKDAGNAETLARSLLPEFDSLADARQRALVNMAFNRGGHLKTSTKIMPAIRKAAASGDESDWAAIPGSMAGSEWAKQVGARATRLGEMFATGNDATA